MQNMSINYKIEFVKEILGEEYKFNPQRWEN